MELAVFGLFAFLAVASALVVVSHKNPIYSTLGLVVTLVSSAALFVLLGAPFIATLQVLVYAGAIVVLFLFVIMLLAIGREQPGDAEGELGLQLPQQQNGQRWGTILGAGVFAGTLLAILWRTYGGEQLEPLTEAFVDTKVLATLLFERYLLAFELIGLLLLVAVVAASVIARRLRPDGDAETALHFDEEA
jgi:NADH-quinone oxidoreductase subunit J